MPAYTYMRQTETKATGSQEDPMTEQHRVNQQHVERGPWVEREEVQP